MACKPPRRRRYRRNPSPIGQAVTCRPGCRPTPLRRSKRSQLGRSPSPLASAAVVLGRVQRSRRNVVAAVGVRLVEASDAPSRGEVHIRIPSGQRVSRRQRVALGDTNPSGDAQSLHAATSGPGWVAYAAIGQMRAATGIAESTGTGLIGQAGGDSGSRVAGKTRQSCPGDPASWKDPL